MLKERGIADEPVPEETVINIIDVVKYIPDELVDNLTSFMYNDTNIK